MYILLSDLLLILLLLLLLVLLLFLFCFVLLSKSLWSLKYVMELVKDITVTLNMSPDCKLPMSPITLYSSVTRMVKNPPAMWET